MRLRHHGAAIGAAHHREAALGEVERRRTRRTRAAAEPQHRAFGLSDQFGQGIEQLRGRRPAAVIGPMPTCSGRGTFSRCTSIGISSDTGPLGAVKRGAGRRPHHADRGTPLPDAEIRLGDRAQHVGLPRHVVDRGAVAVHIGAVDLRRDVEHRRTRRERIDLRARRVAGCGSGAGDDDAERTRNARIGVRHVHGAGFAARRHETNPVVPRDGVQDRHVVDRDHAEHRGHADLGQRVRDEIAHGFRYRRRCSTQHDRTLNMPRGAAGNSSWAPVMKPAAGEQRKAMAPATSSGVPSRSIGMCRLRATSANQSSRVCAGPCARRSGAPIARNRSSPSITELTRIRGANSPASDFTRLCAPARAAAVATM